VKVTGEAVCEGHCSPVDFLSAWCFDRPDMSLVLGPRGGGKSYMAALATHWDSIVYQAHGTRILGGSLAQSEQIYVALRDFQRVTPSVFSTFTRTRASYITGSEVAILAASPTAVRGPHVPTLRLDEVDEMDSDVRDSSLGMCMARGSSRASVSMTSTWHRVGGPMEELLNRGNAGEFPSWTFCIFDVLERCPDERSGVNLERCPDCPLAQWCHSVPDGVLPKAKRANGHYAIDSLIQKVKAVSRRVFESDYLCSGPRADGVWFAFDYRRHISDQAEYNPTMPAYLAVDPGVFTGAVLFQVWEIGGAKLVTVFADYLNEGGTAEANARALRELANRTCNGKLAAVYSDPAGNVRNPIGPTVYQEYARVGLPLTPWARANPSVADSLDMVEGLLNPADGVPRLRIHPRCLDLARAFLAYRRAKRQNQWVDYPEDPQHPAEDLIDSLRGGLHARLRSAPYGLFL
jgi:hypothetical protein